MFRLKFNQKELTEAEIEMIYLELMDFEDIIGKQTRIKFQTENALGKLFFLFEYFFLKLLITKIRL
jgi:hypothetical protein